MVFLPWGGGLSWMTPLGKQEKLPKSCLRRLHPVLATTPGGLLATPRTHCCSCPVWLGHQQPLMDFRVLGLLQGTYLATSSSLKHQCLPICGAPTGLVRSYCTDLSFRLFRWLLLLPPRYWTSQGLVLGNNSFISSHFHSGIL